MPTSMLAPPRSDESFGPINLRGKSGSLFTRGSTVTKTTSGDTSVGRATAFSGISCSTHATERSCSRVPFTKETIEEAVTLFREERDADQKARFQTVADVAFRILFVALSILVTTWGSFLAFGLDLFVVGSPFFAFLVSSSICIFTSIDETHFDIDYDLMHRVKNRLKYWPAMITWSVTRLYYYGHHGSLDAWGDLFTIVMSTIVCLQIAVGFFAICGVCSRLHTKLMSSHMVLQCTNEVIVQYLYTKPEVEPETSARGGRGPELFVLGASCILLFLGYCGIHCVLRTMCRQRVMYYSSYLLLLVWGCVNLLVGVRMLALAASLDKTAQLIVTGITIWMTLLIRFCTRKESVSLFIARRLDRDPQRLKRDGAFMASLLDSVTVAAGETMWVHHGRNDDRYDLFDPRRNWTEAYVLCVDENEITVLISPESVDSAEVASLAPESSAAGGGGCRSPHKFGKSTTMGSAMNHVRSHLMRSTQHSTRSSCSSAAPPIDGESNCPPPRPYAFTVKAVFSKASSSAGSQSSESIANSRAVSPLPSSLGHPIQSIRSAIESTRSSRANSVRRSATGIFQRSRTSQKSATGGHAGKVPLSIPVAGFGKTIDEILDHALENLRCIEWDHMSRKLFSSSKTEAKEDISRFVRQGERIDFFLSHSWYDDPDTKWECIKEVAEEFNKVHRRYPTFWLDKVCIDQSEIADGLKVLPVNVMACRKLLVCCGDTYVERLWCIWEIYTLFAFAREEHALERLVLVPIEGENDSILERLKYFDARKATCYDPNEQARLMKIIKAGDVEVFNEKIQRLATSLEKGVALRDQLAFSSALASRHSRRIPSRPSPQCSTYSGHRPSFLNRNSTVSLSTSSTGPLTQAGAGSQVVGDGAMPQVVPGIP